jgi:choline dehydrogenase-like flavoprotein
MKRLFRGLRGKPPERSYDAVIIGAGIGGLICANLLAREQLRVLLVEQHYMVGGYCSTFRRKGHLRVLSEPICFAPAEIREQP